MTCCKRLLKLTLPLYVYKKKATPNNKNWKKSSPNRRNYFKYTRKIRSWKKF